MLNIFDELWIKAAVEEKQNRFEREARVRRLIRETHTQQNESRKEPRSFAKFLALALKAFGTNGQMNWKL